VNQNGHEEQAPREETGGELRHIIVEWVVMAGDAPGDAAAHTRRENPLEMVVEQEDLQVLRAALVPEGHEPGKGHGEEDKYPEPEPHDLDLSKIPLEGEKGENG